ncbi:MAG: Ig-like domain-containing protein [Rubrivivax sp.]|nr:Ig-like domain-containing protein [Rubrivivax sp.]
MSMSSSALSCLRSWAIVVVVVAIGGCGQGANSPQQLESIEVTPAASTVPRGRSQQFTAMGLFSDGSVVDLTRSVRWTSSAPEVAVLDPATGLAQSVGEGSTQVSAASGSVSGSATLRVTRPVLQFLAITPAPAYAGIGIATPLTATGTYTDGTTTDLTGQVVWTSTSPAVSLGPRPGEVRGLALGTTTIVASLESVTVEAPLVIVAAAWSPAPSPDGGNFADAAVVLQDGRVLALSGRNAQVFDPSTHRWSAAAAMPSDHGGGYSATLLADGRVMVAGGRVSTVELFDPSTGAWSVAASMSTVRREHTATLLADGGVLVVGGRDLAGQTGTVLASAERYDPRSSNWSSAGSLSTGRTLHTATLLADGRMVVVGGAAETTADIYDPATNTWSQTAQMNVDRTQHTATLLRDGRVLVVGGVRPTWNMALRSVESDWASPAELYDPATNTWSVTSVSGGRFRHSASVLPNGQVLVAGGAAWYYFGPGLPDDLARKSLRSVEIYDPVAGRSTPAADMPFESLGHVATQLRGGKTLVIGGHGLVTRLVFRDSGLPRLVTTEVAVPESVFYW